MWAIRGISFAGILLCASGSALGEPTPAKPSGDEATSAATRHYELGLAAARQGRWQQARDFFDKAWRLKQHYQIAANLGMAELKLGRHREAAIHLTYYMEQARGMNHADWEQGREMLAEARANIGAIDIIVDTPNADVFVDGQHIGQSPIKGLVFVDPGLHTVKARLASERVIEQTVHLSPGSQRRVELRSEGAPAQATTSGGVIRSEPGYSPIAPKESPSRPPPSSPEHSWAARNVPVILLGGVTVAAVGAGVGSTIYANELSTRRENSVKAGGAECNTCGREFTGLSQAASDWSNHAVHWFIAAGVAAAGTGAWLVFRPPAQAAEGQEPELSLRVGPGAVGIRGAW